MCRDERVRITWFKNQTIIKNDTVNNMSSESQENICSTLTFSNITTNDSGRYICEVKVEIPILAIGNGNGTVIKVTTREDKADKRARGW